ncbi:MAG: hypothetical protein J6X28_03220 [Bacilli bacterium]|nr:hypothetical protein [Bacilli bacterium]
MKDLHCHLLYGIDDGSKSIEESIQLLKKMVKAGCKEIVLTPHYVRNSKYVCFHSNQGMNNLLWLVLLLIFTWIMSIGFNGSPLIDSLRNILILAYCVFSLFGFINALNNKAKEVPIMSKCNLITIIAGLFGK